MVSASKGPPGSQLLGTVGLRQEAHEPQRCLRPREGNLGFWALSHCSEMYQELWGL